MTGEGYTPSEAEEDLTLSNRWLAKVGLPSVEAENYLPTEDEVRHYASTHGRMPVEWVDRWLQSERARIWDEGAYWILHNRWVDGDDAPPNPYREGDSA